MGTINYEGLIANEQFFRIFDEKQKLVHELPIVPDESVLFEAKKKEIGSQGKGKEKSLEFLALYLFNCFANQSNVDFQIKLLAETLNDTVARVYDVCNVFEAVGLVTKTKVNEFRWLGPNDGQFIQSLRHLKTFAQTQDLKNLFFNAATSTLQDIAERILMLLLLPGYGLTRDQIFFLIYPQADVKKDSSCLRIVKVLKILTAIGLLCYDASGIDDRKTCSMKDNVFMYNGPRVERFTQEEYEEFMTSKETPETVNDTFDGLEVETNTFTIVVDEANEKYFIKDSTFEGVNIENVWIDVVNIAEDTCVKFDDVKFINVEDGIPLEVNGNEDYSGYEVLVEDKDINKKDDLEEFLDINRTFDTDFGQSIRDEFADL